MHTSSAPGGVRPVARTTHADEALPVPGAEPPGPEVFRRACRRLLGKGTGFTDTVVHRIRTEVPYYADPVLAPPDLRPTVGTGVRHGLEAGTDPDAVVLVERYTRELGVRRAEQGRPLDEVLHAYRVAGAAVWNGIVAVVERDGPGELRHLVHAAELVWKHNDRDALLVADAYRQVANGLASRQAERVRLVLAALLESGGDPCSTRDAAAILDLPPDGRYAVAVLRARPPYGRVPSSLPDIAGVRLLGHPQGQWHTLVAHLGDLPLDVFADALEAGPGLRVGISPVVRGLDGLPRARDMAALALSTCRSDGEVARLDARLPDGLLVSRPDLSAELAHQVLQPLQELPPADRDTLMETLGVWIECGGSAARTARRMLCHRNTVLNRLRRCEQITGTDLTRPRDLVRVVLAFDAHRLLGPTAALPAPAPALGTAPALGPTTAPGRTPAPALGPAPAARPR
ncbi:PucR family transcriptional regulator [Streptomyces sp. NPDC016309]|uniref:PucR family transcriptional regulator n=1 Tax=Streptomyces sp. NPDC016309 TaxID=3364965 RepID=UPI0036F9BD8C